MSNTAPTLIVNCERCGRNRADHHVANLTDGVVIGRYVLICPTAVFTAKGYDTSGEPIKKEQ